MRSGVPGPNGQRATIGRYLVHAAIGCEQHQRPTTLSSWTTALRARGSSRASAVTVMVTAVPGGVSSGTDTVTVAGASPPVASDRVAGEMVAGRLVHAYGLSQTPQNSKARTLGIWLTLATITVAAFTCFVLAGVHLII